MAETNTLDNQRTYRFPLNADCGADFISLKGVSSGSLSKLEDRISQRYIRQVASTDEEIMELQKLPIVAFGLTFYSYNPPVGGVEPENKWIRKGYYEFVIIGKEQGEWSDIKDSEWVLIKPLESGVNRKKPKKPFEFFGLTVNYRFLADELQLCFDSRTSTYPRLRLNVKDGKLGDAQMANTDLLIYFGDAPK